MLCQCTATGTKNSPGLTSPAYSGASSLLKFVRVTSRLGHGGLTGLNFLPLTLVILHSLHDAIRCILQVSFAFGKLVESDNVQTLLLLSVLQNVAPMVGIELQLRRLAFVPVVRSLRVSFSSLCTRFCIGLRAAVRVRILSVIVRIIAVFI
jgi:hypothetical protein